MSPREARIIALLFGVLGLVVAGLLLFAPMRDVVLRFVHDDAFYYLASRAAGTASGFPRSTELTRPTATIRSGNGFSLPRPLLFPARAHSLAQAPRRVSCFSAWERG